MIRHVTIHTMEDLERPWLRRYLRTAIEMVSQPTGTTKKQAVKSKPKAARKGK